MLRFTAFVRTIAIRGSAVGKLSPPNATRLRSPLLLGALLSGALFFILPGFVASSEKSPPSSGQVVLEGHLSATSAAQRDLLRFWITVTNRSDVAVDDVRIEHLDTPGFEIRTRCWVSGAPSGCGVPTGAPDLARAGDETEIAPHLAPGEARTIWGDLEANRPNDPASFVAVIGWTTGGTQRSWSSVVLGNAASLTYCEKLWASFRDLVKDLGLPILLVLVPVGFGYYQHLRDQHEQAEETRRAQISQTWNLMLPDSHMVTRKYYLPILAALGQANRNAKKYLDSPARESYEAQNDLTLAFHYVMLFAWHAREATWRVGGFFFKDRIGEQLAFNAYLMYWNSYGSDSKTLQNRGRLLDLMNAKMSFPQFIALRTHVPPPDGPATPPTPSSEEIWEAAWKDFQRWMKDNGGNGYLNGALPYLRAYGAVMLYEANRPYELWYGSNKSLELLGGTEEILLSLTEELTTDEIKRYLAAAKGEVLESVKR